MDVGFNKYWQEKAYYEANAKANAVEVPVAPSQSPILNKSILFRTIEDRDSMSEAELRYFIESNFFSIINNVFDKSVYVKYVKAFEEERFLSAFIDVLHHIRYFDSDIMIKCNLLAYHYITSDERYKNATITRLMIRMSTIVNSNNAVRFKKFNMPENLESIILLTRYSDFNLSICVKRIDLVLVSSPILYDILNMSEYEVNNDAIEFLAKLLFELFPSSDWSYVLPYFMTDVLPDSDDNNPQTMWITPEVESMDSALNLAVLKILDEMIDDSFQLRKILMSYAEGYKILNRKQQTRFSFQSISFEYERLSSALAYLKNEGIYVP